jgi:two-component system alkaline phosphatase synthesis response regulator PhoP
MKENDQLRHIPVIMATAKGTEYDVIQSLDLGADDYLVKPFGIMETVSRVKAVLRRCNHPTPSRQIGVRGLILDPEKHTVSVDGMRITLTNKEYKLLHLFLSQPGVAFTREQLLQTVWKTDYLGESRTVDMHIRTLRQKLGAYGTMIETVRNVGYRMEIQHDK